MRGKMRGRGICFSVAFVFLAGLMFVLFSPAQAAEPKTILIGDSNPLTGGGAYWGIGSKNALDLAMDKCNKAGGVTIKGQQYLFKIIHEDDKYKGSEAVKAINKLIFTDKVQFIVGPLGTAAVKAVQPITEAQKMVMIIDTYAGPDILRNMNYTFRAMVPPTHFAPSFFKWVKDKHPQLKTLIHIAANDATGWGATNGDNDACHALGMKVLGSEFFERGSTDFTAMVTRILSQNPDFLSMGGSPPGEAALLIKQAREMGYKGRIIHSGMLEPSQLGPIAGWENIEGIIQTGIGPEGPGVPKAMKQYFIDYEAKYGNVNSFAPYIYDMFDILVMGIKKANSLDSTKVRDAIEQMDEFDTIWGKARWGGKELYGNNHQLFRPTPVSIIKDKKLICLEMVTPQEVPPPSQEWHNRK
ncbi:MAG: hypothetical protein C4582_13830 [Desulfobacteraceae bacterium]|nr:MAG: hypothetical protein C4582_13830 [Desulfobacteraceae bacterium]